MGSAAGREARYYNSEWKSSLFLWAPTVDMERDPRWGRTEEGYGEDPFLTGIMAAEMTKGMYGDDEKYAQTIPTLKHFYANNHEEDRTADNASVPDCLKHNYYLKPFERAIKDGMAKCVMTSYNEINGVEAMCNPELSEILKKEWGLIFSVTDAWDFVENVTRHKHDSCHAEALARTYKNGGADIITDEHDVVDAAVLEALDKGLISEKDLDRAIFGVLKARFLLGEFDEDCRYSRDIQNPCRTYDQRSAEKAAEESLVLLRNSLSVLPFDKNGKISVIGIHADMNFPDWYTGTSERNPTILDALVAYRGRENVIYESGNDIIALRNAATGFYFEVDDNGKFVCDAPLINERCLLELFEWENGEVSFRSKFNGKFLREDKTLVCDSDTVYGWFVKEKFTLIRNENQCVLKNCRGKFLCVNENKELSVCGKLKPPKNSFLNIEMFSSGIERARRAATESHNVVIFCGNNPLVGARENFDRKTLELPERQKKLAGTVLALNQNAVLFLISGFPYSISDKFKTVVHSSHGGPAMGQAIAKALFGEISPAGRCPMTWYSSENELCNIKDYNIIRTETTYRYYNGTPLFPFGHGLSYTTFGYSSVRLNKAEFREGDCVELTLDICNIGARDSDEVVQLYVCAPRFSSAVPKKELRAFKRIHIDGGETETITLSFNVNDLKLWDENQNKFVLFGGVYELQAGASSENIFRTCEIRVIGEDYRGLDVTRAISATVSWEYSNVEFRTSKDLYGYALIPKYGGELVFENCCLNGENKLEIEVSNPAAQSVITVADARNGKILASAAIPQSGAIDRFSKVTVDFDSLQGLYDLKFIINDVMSFKSFRLFEG